MVQSSTSNQFQLETEHLYHCFIKLPPILVQALNHLKNPSEVILQLSWVTNKVESIVHVTWDGLPSNLTHKNDTIILDTGYAISLGLVKGTSINVKRVGKPIKAKSVELVPKSLEDWEILQLNAGLIEQQFLNQCRCLQLDQFVVIYTLNNTKVTLKVKSILPDSTKGYIGLDNDTELYIQPIEDLKKGKEDNNNNNNNDKFGLKVLRILDKNWFKKEEEFNALNDFTVLINPLIFNIKNHTNSIINYPNKVLLSSIFKSSWSNYEEPKTNNNNNTVNSTINNTTISNSNSNNNNNINSNSIKPINNNNNNNKIDGLKKLNGQSNLIVNVKYDLKIPLNHILMSDKLMDSLSCNNKSKLSCNFNFNFIEVKCRSLKFKPIYGGVGDVKKTGNNKIKSWIHNLIMNYLNLQTEQNDLILTHNSILTLSTSTNQMLTIQFDLSISNQNQQQPTFTKLSKDWKESIELMECDGIYLPLNLMKLIQIDRKVKLDLNFLGGVDDLIDEIVGLIRVGLGANEVKKVLGVNPWMSILICGGKGSGKTSILKTISHISSNDPLTLAYPQFLDMNTLTNLPIHTIKDKLNKILYNSLQYTPSLILLDNLDSLILPEQEHMDSFRFKQLSEIFINWLMDINQKVKGIKVIGSALEVHKIHPNLVGGKGFTDIVTIKPPGKTERVKILDAIIKHNNTEMVRQSLPNLDTMDIASMTEGYLPADLKTLTERAVHQAAMRQFQLIATNPTTLPQLQLTQPDYQLAIKDYIPTALKNVKLQTSGGIKWSDIGGLTDTKYTLRETLEWPIKYQPIFATCPLRLRSGLLLYGYPGCGKTMLACAVSLECQLNFVQVKGPEILNKYIGASEQSVRDLFQRAKAAKPCVLFFDEFEAIAPRRGHDSTGVTDRVVNQLLTEMDGAEGLDGVYVLAATSRPDLIDPALLRPGRLDKSLLCAMPDREDRLSILKAHATKFQLSHEAESELENIADKTENFTGADLQALLYNAHLEAIHTELDKIHPIEQEDEINENDGMDIKVIQLQSDQPKPMMTSAELDHLKTRIQTIQSSQALPNIQPTKSNLKELKEDEKIGVISLHHLHQGMDQTNPSLPEQERTRLDKIYFKFQYGQQDKDAIGKKSTLG